MGFFSNLFSTKQSAVDPFKDYKLEKIEGAAKLVTGGNWQELLGFSKKWAEDEPHNFFAWQYFGDALAEMGKADEAVPMYQKCLEFASQHSTDFCGFELSASGIWYRLGNAYVKLGDNNKAVDAFIESTRLKPEEAVIWNSLAIAYCNITKPQEAIKALEKAIGLEPQNIIFLSNLGIIYARCGPKQEVTATHKRISEIDTKAAQIFLAKANEYARPEPKTRRGKKP